MITIKIAMNDLGYIGKDNKLMWHSSEDLRNFKKRTLNKTIVMGKNTWLSLGGKPLPNRTNYVVTHDKTIPNAIEMKDIIELSKDNDLIIIGGNLLISYFIDEYAEYVDCVELSIIDDQQQGDVFIMPCLMKLKRLNKKVEFEYFSFRKD